MRSVFTSLVCFLQISVFAQVPEIAIPDSASLKKQTVFTPVIKYSKEFVKTKLAATPTRELKILGRSALVISAVSLTGAATYAFGDEPLREFMLSNRNDVTHKISGFIEPLGRSKYMIVVSGAVYGSGLALKNQKLQRTGILVSSSLLINDFVTSNLKDEFQRHRPNISSQNHYFEGGEGGRHHGSFPSSHTSTAFTFATSVATVYKDSKWVPPVAYSAATLVGLSRIHDNMHWATDVLAGATVGFLTAKAANFILTQTEKQLAKRKINIYLIPNVSNGSAGLSFGGSF